MPMNKILVRPTKNRVFVDIYDRGESRLRSGLIIKDDDFSERGIRPREARVLAIGRDVKDIKIGDIVLIPHGDWTRKFLVPTSNGEPMSAWATEEDRILTIIERGK